MNNSNISSQSVVKKFEQVKLQTGIVKRTVHSNLQRLSDRESIFLAIACCFILILLCYLFVVEPLKENLTLKLSEIEKQQNDVLWMEQQLPIIEQLRKKTPTLILEDQRPLAALIEQTLQMAQLRESTDRILPENNSVQIWMEKAPFETALKWISKIGTYGVTVKRIEIAPHADGLGNVDLSLILTK